MSGPFLIGIDGGSQSTKVVVHGADGRLVCAAQAPLRPMHQPAPGVVEHPDDDLWDSLVAAIRQAVVAFPHDLGEIAGIGLCTIRFCRAHLRTDGSLASPVLSWMDARVSRPYTRHDPSVAYVSASSGYLGHRLTGALVDTAANYAGQWPLHPDGWRWSPPDAAGAYPGTDLTRTMLLDLVLPGQVIGRLTADAATATGLPAGLPVVATANDKAVEALGCGLVDSGTVLLSLGTYIAGMVTAEPPGTALESGWVNHACIPHRHLIESHGVRRGMWTVSWLRDLLGAELTTRAAAAGVSVEEVMNEAAAQVPVGSDGLLTVPDWLAPTEASFRRGVILGFDARHGWPHLYRSVLEGIALTMATRIGAMCGELGLAPSEVVVGGGGAASEVMMQIVADTLDLPARRSSVASAAGLGAAICAAAGVGLYPDVVTAAAAMVRLGDRFTPRPDAVAQYARLRPVHASIHDHTDPVLARTADILC